MGRHSMNSAPPATNADPSIAPPGDPTVPGTPTNPGAPSIPETPSQPQPEPGSPEITPSEPPPFAPDEAGDGSTPSPDLHPAGNEVL